MGNVVKVIALENTPITRRGQVWTFDDELHDFLRHGDLSISMKGDFEFDKWFWILQSGPEIRLTDSAVLQKTSSCG